MIRLAPALLLWALALPAAAEVWTWTDSKGEVHYTDDPGTIPDADRKAAHRMNGEGGTLTVVPRNGNATEEDGEHDGAVAAVDARRADLEKQLAELKHQLANAEREWRKYSAGGRPGAADAAARAVVDDLKKVIQQHEAELALLVEQLDRGEPAPEPDP